MTDRDEMIMILGRLEGKIDAFGQATAASQSVQDDRIKDLENTVRQLWWKVATIAGALGTGTAWLVK